MLTWYDAHVQFHVSAYLPISIIPRLVTIVDYGTYRNPGFELLGTVEDNQEPIYRFCHGRGSLERDLLRIPPS